MRTRPTGYNDSGRQIDPSTKPIGVPVGLGRRAGAFVLRELCEMLPPTLFFFIGFNLIVLTTNLILANYLEAFGNFFVATTSALVVGKSVLVANAMSLIRRYDSAPLIQPILFKTIIYWAIVFVVRLLEHFVRFWLIEGNPLGDFLPHMIATFAWDRFAAIQIWIFVLFLIYVTASELNHLLGDGELRRILFTHRASRRYPGTTNLPTHPPPPHRSHVPLGRAGSAQ